MANPDVKIRIDPRARKNAIESLYVARRCNGLRDRQCANFGVLLNTRLKLAEEFAPVARIILPGVLAIENN